MPVQIPIANMPVHLVCCGEDATVAFVRVSEVDTIFCRGVVDAVFHGSGFTIDGLEFDYQIRYAYKEIPVMLAWLQAQNLIMPTFI